VRNIERVTILFSKLPSSSSFETQAIIKYAHTSHDQRHDTTRHTTRDTRHGTRHDTNKKRADVCMCFGRRWCRVLPRVLVDFFRVEQALTLVIGEFVKAVAKGAPSPVTHVLYKVPYVPAHTPWRTTTFTDTTRHDTTRHDTTRHDTRRCSGSWWRRGTSRRWRSGS